MITLGREDLSRGELAALTVGEFGLTGVAYYIGQQILANHGGELTPGSTVASVVAGLLALGGVMDLISTLRGGVESPRG